MGVADVDTKSIPMLVVGIVVAVLISVCVLIPVIDTYTQDSKVVYNNPSATVSQVVDGEHTIFIDGTDMSVKIDDVATTIASNNALIMSDALNLLYQKSDSQVQLYSNQHLYTYQVLTGDVEITITADEIEIEYGDDDRITETYDTVWTYIYDPNGTYGLYRMYNQQKTLYVNSIDDIRGSNILVTTHDWFSYVGEDVTLLSGTETTATYTLTPVSGMKDLYTISVGGTGTGYSFEVDNSGTPYTVHPWMAVAPLQVTAYSDMDSTIVPLLNIIPLLVIIGIVLGVVGMIVYRR